MPNDKGAGEKGGGNYPGRIYGIFWIYGKICICLMSIFVFLGGDEGFRFGF